MTWSAVASIARRELARGWRSLLVLGVLTGLGAACVLGGAVVARRTDSVYDRLLAATAAEDARVHVFAGRSAAEAVASLPSVAASWSGDFVVGMLDAEEVFFAGVVSGPPRTADLAHPVLLAGRWYDDAAADEAVVTDALAEALALAPGDRLPLTLLTTEEFGRFDTGFGEPDGAAVALTVTGVVRAPERSLQGSPILAGRAFGRRHHAGSHAGTIVSVRLRDDADPADFAAELDALTAQLPPPAEGFEEFPPLEAIYPQDGRGEIAAASAAVVGGLLAVVVIAAAATALASAQAWQRRHRAGAADQRVERTLGATPVERTGARVLPALLAAVTAAVVAAAGAALGGLVEPLGRAGRLEPTPGWLLDVPVTVVGSLSVSVLVLVLAAATASASGRPRPPRPLVRRSRLLELVPDRWVRPSTVAGLAFAADRGGGGRGWSLRSAGVGVLVGVTGLAATLPVGASLSSLAAEPLRWGWSGDASVVDVTPEIVADLVADPRVGQVSTFTRSLATVGGRSVSAVAVTPAVGSLGWQLLEGRMPARDDEVTVGPALARALDLHVGDRVSATAPDGSPVALTVVGTGFGPVSMSSDFAREVALTPGALAGLQHTTPLPFAQVEAAPGTSPEELTAHLASRYELGFPEPPVAVATLLDARDLPAWLLAFLATVVLAALGHGAVVSARRRRRDVATLRALGQSLPEARRSLRVSQLVSAGTAVVVGVPVGLALGRLVWWLIAHDAGLGTAATVPWLALAGVGLAVLVTASLVARLAGRRVGRGSVAAALRGG